MEKVVAFFISYFITLWNRNPVTAVIITITGMVFLWCLTETSVLFSAMLSGNRGKATRFFISFVLLLILIPLSFFLLLQM